MILSIRKDPTLAQALGISGKLSQESPARKRVELLFQSLDRDDSRDITLQEFMIFQIRVSESVTEGCKEAGGPSRRLSVKDMVKNLERGKEHTGRVSWIFVAA